MKKVLFLIIFLVFIFNIFIYYFFWEKISSFVFKKSLPQNPSETENQNNNENQSLEIANPASVFCQEQGGVLENRKDQEGREKGFCLFEDGSECEEWEFYEGKCQKGEKFCKDLCGDGICQEIVCQAVGCPCAETKETCPQDCD